ncbi:MAG: CPBP family intramembrane metalloprotease [Oscillospiraceae bacterium]|nr:CPBP family intramembrane metalloprotease [Oscillospiraceae bacterium]
MYKFFSSLIWAIVYALIYFIVMNASGFFVSFIYSITGYARRTNPLTCFLNLNKTSYFLAIIVSLILFILVTKVRNRKFFDFCGFKNADNKLYLYCIFLTLGLIPVITMVTIFLSLIFKSYGGTSKVLELFTHDPIMVLFLVIFIPIMEEIVFRGLILNEIISKTKNYILAILIQGALFGILHGNIVQGIYAFLLGIVLGFIAYSFHSIYPGIIMHCVFNLMGSIVMVKLANITSNAYFNSVFMYIIFLAEFICLFIAVVFLYKELVTSG